MSLRDVLDRLVTSEPFEGLCSTDPGRSWSTSRPARGFLAGLAVALDGPVLVVTPRREAEDLEAEVGAYLGDDVALLPPGTRCRTRGWIRRPRSPRVAPTPSRVCAPRSVRRRRAVPGRDAADAADARDRRRAGARDRRGAPARRARGALSDLGYARVDVVEHRGEFAVRGGVVDVFPGIARRPARLEYWGDESSDSGVLALDAAVDRAAPVGPP